MGAMLLNREGRRVIVDPARLQWYVESQGYQRISYVVKGRTTDTGRVAVVREVGGLGDVICVQSVVAGLQARKQRVTLYTPRRFWPVCIAEDLVDTDGAFPDPGPEADHDWVFNMFCPAGDYEGEAGMRPLKGRVRNFCEAAGVEPEMPPIVATVGAPVRLGAGPQVGIQPKSENPSKDLSMGQVAALVAELGRRGIACHLFHDRPLQTTARCTLHVGKPLDEIARIVRGLDAMVAVDSGLLHLAACLGVPTIGIFGPTNGPITCEFYPSVSIVQAGQGGTGCFTPCYYAAKPNGYACRKRQCVGIGELDVKLIADEVARRTLGGKAGHYISDHWLGLNHKAVIYHGGRHE